MYAESYFEEWIKGLFEHSFLAAGLPAVEQTGGPQMLGIEPGLPNVYYLYERVLVAEPVVAGSRFWARPDELKRLRPGERLRLVRERGNRYDPNAVGVYLPGGGKIGYVPRFATPLIAGRIDSGVRVFARVRRADSGGNIIAIQLYFYRPSILSAG